MSIVVFLTCNVYLARFVATRADNTVTKININRSSGLLRLNDNPVKLGAIHTVAVLLSSTDIVQQQTIMLPRYNFLGKVIQLVAQDILSSGNARGLFVEPEAALSATIVHEMEISEDGDVGDSHADRINANVGGNSSVSYLFVSIVTYFRFEMLRHRWFMMSCRA